MHLTRRQLQDDNDMIDENSNLLNMKSQSVTENVSAQIQTMQQIYMSNQIDKEFHQEYH